MSVTTTETTYVSYLIKQQRYADAYRELLYIRASGTLNGAQKKAASELSTILRQPKILELTRGQLRIAVNRIDNGDLVAAHEALHEIPWSKEANRLSNLISSLSHKPKTSSIKSVWDRLRFLIPLNSQWSEEDDAQLMRFVQSNVGTPTITAYLNRTERDIQERIAKLGLESRGSSHIQESPLNTEATDIAQSDEKLRLEQWNQHLESEVAALTERNSDLAALLEEAFTQLGELRSANLTYEVQNTDLFQQLRILQSDKLDHEHRSDHLKSEILTLTQRNNDLTALLSEAFAQLDELRSTNMHLKAQNTALSQESRSVHAHTLEKTHHASPGSTKLKKQLESEKKTSHQLRLENKNLFNTLDDFKSQVSTLRKEIDHLLNEKNVIASQQTNVAQRMGQLSTEKAELKVQIGIAQETIKNLEAQNSKLSNHATSLQGTVNQLRGELSRLIAEYDDKVRNLEQDNRTLHAQLEQITARPAPRSVDKRSATNKDDSTLAYEISEIVKDYREDNLGPRFVSQDRVQHWIEQFPQERRTIILKEMHHLLTNCYFDKERLIRDFLERLFHQNAMLSSGNHTSRIHFLDIQRNGSSQRDLLDLMNNVVYSKTRSYITRSSMNSDHFIYLDDAIFSGSRVVNDITKWLKQTKPYGSKISFYFLIGYESGINRLKGELAQLSGMRKNEFDIVCFNQYSHEQCFFPKLHRSEDVDHFRKRILCDKSLDEDNLNLFRSHQNKKGSIFSGERSRNVIEEEFLKAGARVIVGAQNPSKVLKPLGFDLRENLGFGAFFITYRNVANNSPLALWYGHSDKPLRPGHPFNLWFPLFPRSTYEKQPR